MTSSGTPYVECYVWIWLPGQSKPVVAGRLSRSGSQLVFNYGRSYLERSGAIPIFLPELPLDSGIKKPVKGAMHSSIRDASPDAWGRRVILNRRTGKTGTALDAIETDDELGFLLESGSDRIGALDFQASPTEYVSRIEDNASLAELLEASERVEKGLPLSEALDRVLNHGTSIGGARPKAILESGGRKYIAKFSASNDAYSVVKGEYIAMRLAALAGLNVAPVSLNETLDKDVLLIERFDRVPTDTGWLRRAMVSALTILGLDEMEARYASYGDLAEKIRYRFTDPKITLIELYRRMVFNVLIGNTDDHARNHAAFWDGEMLELTPSYDICPQGRTGGETSQAMLLVGNDRSSRITTLLDSAKQFFLHEDCAVRIINDLVETIATNWSSVINEAKLTPVDRRLFAGGQFLNISILYGLSERNTHLDSIIKKARQYIIKNVQT
ncbi:type II toxin-antitoxin system HipA family toxin [Eilatimonas milleporae]|uniref:Serine/threonine-protein kinase HipA n=1 Tax=Eilatimonas milleporae TaxID=911205 RepID=A0A3M0C5D0_9PROT|nr:type II toxin-antitoxin system HipA family toxin [Eilatimonas milleporae]RMB02026.1 serine/threonine-protein kinase HipA [Eilatimonas milleporae]